MVFDVEKHNLRKKQQATLTIQLAAAKTAAGNTDVFNASQSYSNLPYTVVIKGHELEPWVILLTENTRSGTRVSINL